LTLRRYLFTCDCPRCLEEEAGVTGEYPNGSKKKKKKKKKNKNKNKKKQ